MPESVRNCFGSLPTTTSLRGEPPPRRRQAAAVEVTTVVAWAGAEVEVVEGAAIAPGSTDGSTAQVGVDPPDPDVRVRPNCPSDPSSGTVNVPRTARGPARPPNPPTSWAVPLTEYSTAPFRCAAETITASTFTSKDRGDVEPHTKVALSAPEHGWAAVGSKSFVVSRPGLGGSGPTASWPLASVLPPPAFVVIDVAVRSARVAFPPVGTATAGADTVEVAVAGAAVVVVGAGSVVDVVGATVAAGTTSALGDPAGPPVACGPATTATAVVAVVAAVDGAAGWDELTSAGIPTEATAATAVAASVPIAGASRLGAASTSGGADAAAAVIWEAVAVAWPAALVSWLVSFAAIRVAPIELRRAALVKKTNTGTVGATSFRNAARARETRARAFCSLMPMCSATSAYSISIRSRRTSASR